MLLAGSDVPAPRNGLIFWFTPAWLPDHATGAIETTRQQAPELAPEAHEAAAVRDEVHALMRGIMEACGIPQPTMQRRAVIVQDTPDEHGTMRRGFTVDTSNGGPWMTKIVGWGPETDHVEAEMWDLGPASARLAELGEGAGPAGDMWWLDAAVVKVLGLDDNAADTARRRWAAGECLPWYLEDLANPQRSKATRVVVWEARERVRERERKRAAEAGQLPVILWEGDTYVGASKAAPATSWALGAPGQSEVVELHGEQYATIHKPRVVGVVHGGLPGQRIVQLAFPFQTEAAALVTLAANDAAVLSPLVGKLLVWLLATVPTAGYYPATLEELARAMHKHTKFRREYTARTAEALAPLEELRLVLEDHTFVRLFDMRAALKTAAPDAPIEVGYSPAMMRATNPFHHDKGQVLINRSAIERMPLEYRGALYLRAYVRSAGWWNDHLGMGQPLPEYTAEALAGVFNAMSAHAATDPGAGRKQKSKAVKGVEETLEWLEGQGLAVLHQRGAGRHRRMSVKPPEAHVEAYRERRKRGARPDG
jgi:hypothetical protein